METEEIKQNSKLGAFVVGGLVLFIVSVFFIGSENNFFNRTFVVSAVFKNVEGLKEGDKVWLSGVQIGTVKSVQIVMEGQVVVNLSLREKQNEFIRKNATAFIGSDGLVGNKIVVIRPGNSEEIIADNDTINAFSPADTQELINIAKEVGENTRSITSDFKNIADKVNKGQGIVGELLNEGALAIELRQTLSDLRIAGYNAAKASENLSAVTHEIKQGNGLLPTLISDTTYTRTFTQALANIKKVSNDAAVTAQNLQNLTTKINDHNNALGVMLADTTFARRLQKTMKNTESASVKLDENMEALKHNFLTRGYFRRKEKGK